VIIRIAFKHNKTSGIVARLNKILTNALYSPKVFVKHVLVLILASARVAQLCPFVVVRGCESRKCLIICAEQKVAVFLSFYYMATKRFFNEAFCIKSIRKMALPVMKRHQIDAFLFID
jgi:hypothetical protein